MTDHLAGEEILDAGERQPAFCSRYIRNIGRPGFVGAYGDTCVRQDILRHWQGMGGLGGRRKPLHLLAA